MSVIETEVNHIYKWFIQNQNMYTLEKTQKREIANCKDFRNGTKCSIASPKNKKSKDPLNRPKIGEKYSQYGLQLFYGIFYPMTLGLCHNRSELYKKY
jgi:hypothetical protein